MKNRRRIIGIGILLGIIAVAGILWPRPRLRLYETPVLNAGREHVRVSLLVPIGWEARDDTSDASTDSRQDLWIERPERPDWKPVWLQSLFPGKSENPASVYIRFVKGHDSTILYGLEKFADQQVACWTIDRRTGCTVWYQRRNHKEFDATWLAILGSARVIRIREEESGK